MQKGKQINRVDRSRAVLLRNFQEDDFVDAPPEVCVDFIWELTREIWSLSGSKDAERKMQRHIAVLRKPQH
jgi:hypothetical protein